MEGLRMDRGTMLGIYHGIPGDAKLLTFAGTPVTVIPGERSETRDPGTSPCSDKPVFLGPG